MGIPILVLTLGGPPSIPNLPLTSPGHGTQQTLDTSKCAPNMEEAPIAERPLSAGGSKVTARPPAIRIQGHCRTEFI